MPVTKIYPRQLHRNWRLGDENSLTVRLSLQIHMRCTYIHAYIQEQYPYLGIELG